MRACCLRRCEPRRQESEREKIKTLANENITKTQMMSGASDGSRKEPEKRHSIDSPESCRMKDTSSITRLVFLHLKI